MECFYNLLDEELRASVDERKMLKEKKEKGEEKVDMGNRK